MVKTGKKGFIATLIFVTCTYLFLYVPLIILLVFSFNTEGFPSPWKGFTLKWYHELFHSPHLWASFLNSLIEILELNPSYEGILLSELHSNFMPDLFC